jgi:predicted ATPase
MGTYVTTLPAQRTTLIGRDDLVASIRTLVREHRLVCLTGPGGVGKTRAAVEASGRELGAFPDGVFFADLTPATDRSGILAAVVSGIRLSVPPDRSTDEHLGIYLRERRALLVVDNCEHVVDEIAALVDQLLTEAPDLRVLATSREPLDLYGECCIEVPTLDVDGPGSAGVQLFTARALAAAGDLSVDDAGLETIAEIVGRLDGIPLAIELAAARSNSLTPTQILTHLDDRFAL